MADSKKTVDALAEALQGIAEGIDEGNYSEESAMAAQIARRLDKDGAGQLWDLASKKVDLGYRGPGAEIAISIIQGIATAALIDGVSSTGVSTASTISVTNLAQAGAASMASARASVPDRIDTLLKATDLPDNARQEVDSLKAAIEKGEDKTSILARTSKIAGMLRDFPALAQSVYELTKDLL